MNALDQIAMPSTEQLKQAEALAGIQKMHEDLNAVLAENEQLRRDLHRAEDRVAMLVEANDRMRIETLMFRDKVVELATIQGQIRLATGAAEEILMQVRDLTEAPPPGQPSQARDALAKL